MKKYISALLSACIALCYGCGNGNDNGDGLIDWVKIPKGSFTMGSTIGDSDEQPVHSVNISTFYLSRTEVTVSQYKECVDFGDCREPASSLTLSNWGVPGRENHPVNYVPWHSASKFCEYVKGRLPTEAEWEYAARSGGQDVTYPWGEQTATCQYAVMVEEGPGCGENRTWEVCSKTDGNTQHGLCDMAGNVQEWVQDWYHDTYTGAPSDGSAWEDPVTDIQVTRGGSAFDELHYIRTTERTISLPPGISTSDDGFRCARSAN